MWKRLKFCRSGNTLKKEAGSGSKLGSIWLFEEPEAEAFFIKHGARMWKRKHFEERNLKRKQKNSTASTSLHVAYIDGLKILEDCNARVIQTLPACSVQCTQKIFNYYRLSLRKQQLNAYFLALLILEVEVGLLCFCTLRCAFLPHGAQIASGNIHTKHSPD